MKRILLVILTLTLLASLTWADPVSFETKSYTVTFSPGGSYGELTAKDRINLRALKRWADERGYEIYIYTQTELDEQI